MINITIAISNTFDRMRRHTLTHDIMEPKVGGVSGSIGGVLNPIDRNGSNSHTSMFCKITTQMYLSRLRL